MEKAPVELMSKIDNLFVLVGSCPSSHKYAFMNGKYCCRTNKEKFRAEKYDDLCDGGEISIDSRCCVVCLDQNRLMKPYIV